MESFFKALSNRDALWVVMHLAAEGPQRQADLIGALHKARPNREPRNSGSMSNLVAPLIRVGIVHKDEQTDGIRLTNPEQVRRLLTLVSAMAVAAATDSSREADEQHARLMRAITQESTGATEAG